MQLVIVSQRLACVEGHLVASATLASFRTSACLGGDKRLVLPAIIAYAFVSRTAIFVISVLLLVVVVESHLD